MIDSLIQNGLLTSDVLSYKKKIVFNAGAESILEYYGAKKSTSPNIQFLFSPFGLPFVPIEIAGSNVSNIIKSFSWTKDRNNPGGVGSVVFAPDANVVKEIVRIIDKYTGNSYSQIWGGIGVDLEDLFKPRTLCQLWINGYHVMTGYVQSISRTASVTNNSKDVSYTMVFSELGNIYNMNTMSMDFIVKDLMDTNLADSIHKVMDTIAELKYVPLSVGISTILNAWLTTLFAEGVRSSDGFPLSMRMLATPNPLGGIGKASLASSLTCDTSLFQMHSSGGGQQSIWGFLQNFMPSPWMEFFTESGGRTIVTGSVATLEPPAVLFPGFNYVVARTVPYSNPLIGVPNPAHIWKTLGYELNVLSMIIGGDFVIITDDIIQEKTIGTDSVNQKTVFHANYTSKQASGATDANSKGIKSTGPLNPFAAGGIKHYGLQEMFETIESTNLQSAGAAASYVERIAKKISGIPGQMFDQNALAGLLAVWFRNQSKFREGEVTVKGLPYARAGMYCLYLPTEKGYIENIRDIAIYYIDSLTHNYSLDNTDVNFTTTLNLVRGTPMPMSFSQTALLLFDWEVLPPMSGLVDGEYTLLKALGESAKFGVPGVTG
jgi:hypothetical protein